MRYSLTSEAISMINRVIDVEARQTTTHLGFEVKGREDIDRFEGTMGGVASYGYKNLPLLAAMWAAADLATDYNGEDDAAYDTYPVLQTSWELTLVFPVHMDETMKEAEDSFHGAADIARDFENQLYVACCVSNAIIALENGISNIWSSDDLLEAVNKEFWNDRKQVADRVYDKLMACSYFAERRAQIDKVPLLSIKTG